MEEQFIGEIASLDFPVRLTLVERPANGQTLMSRFLNGNTNSTEETSDLWFLPVLVPNRRVMQSKPNGGFQYLKFSEKAVAQLAHSFIKAPQPILNGHGGESLQNAFVVESWLSGGWLVDKASKVGFLGLPKGTWMVGVNLPFEFIPKNWAAWGLSLEAGFQFQSLERDKKLQLVASYPLAKTPEPIAIAKEVPTLEAEADAAQWPVASYADGVVQRLTHYQNLAGWSAL